MNICNKSIIDKYIPLIQEIIKNTNSNAFSLISPELKKELDSSFLVSFGKMVRSKFIIYISLLIIESNKKAGKNIQNDNLLENLLKISAIVELIHTGSLIHDDIIDDSDLRRGHNSMHKSIGTKKAILIGDMILTSAISIVKDIKGIRSSQIYQIIQCISSNLFNLIAGEMEDESINYTILNKPIEEIEKKYYEVIDKKTSALFLMGIQMVNILLKSSKSTIRKTEEIAKLLGRVFQIKDDLLDYQEIKKKESFNNVKVKSNISKSNIDGKTIYSDIKNGKLTIITVLLLKQKNAKAHMVIKNIIKNLYRNQEDGTNNIDKDLHVESFLEEVRKYKIKEKTTKIILKKLNKLNKLTERQFKNCTLTKDLCNFYVNEILQ